MTWAAPAESSPLTASSPLCGETVARPSMDLVLSIDCASRFSTISYVDTVSMNLLVRIFQARRHLYGSRAADDRGWTSREAASRHHPFISVALLAGRNNILTSSRPTHAARRGRSS